MRSLTWKLVTALALVTLTSVAAVGILAARSAAVQLDAYVTSGTLLRAQNFAPSLASFYASEGGWTGIDEALESLQTTVGPGRMMGRQRWQDSSANALFGAQYRVIVADPDGIVIADTSDSNELGVRLDKGELGAGAPIQVDSKQVGTVLVLNAASELNDTLAIQFRGAVTRSVLIAGFAVGIVAVLVGFVLSRQVLAPLGKLTVAAHRIAGGDLSQRVEVTGQDEVGDLARMFNTMAASLQQQQELRHRLVADVSHELRTPLAVVRGNLEALLDGVHPLTRENVASILDEALLLGRLTDDLRELALAEAGQLPLHRAPLALSELAAKMQASIEPLAADRGITLLFDVPEELPAVAADWQRLSQILHNLLANALRHTPAGGNIRVSAAALPGEKVVRVRVTDTGSGIPPDELPHLFERFYGGDRERRREHDGTGLGLAIVKQLVEAHGGQIRVESRPNEETTFEFTLPVA